MAQKKQHIKPEIPIWSNDDPYRNFNLQCSWFISAVLAMEIC